jgi:DNA replication protein DnaC
MKTAGKIAKNILKEITDNGCYARLIGGKEYEKLDAPKRCSEIQCPECQRFEMVSCHTEEGKIAICANVLCPTMDRMRIVRENERLAGIENTLGKKLTDLTKLGVPISHLHCKMSNFNPASLDVLPKEGQQTLDMITAFLTNDEWCLVLNGGAGKGKTHLACALLRKLHAMGRDVQFTTIPPILGALREAQVSNKNEYVVTGRYIARDVLCLDDLGSTRGSDFQAEKFYELLDGRYQARKKTIVTTNFLFADLEKSFGKRLTRRLSENTLEVSFKIK